jgi:hypothetical protein
MKDMRKALCLWLLLIAAQQGAVVHELSHFYGSDSISLHADTGDTADGTGDTAERTCTLCPVFAQATTPAFSHAFHIPLLVRADAKCFSEPQHEAIDTAVPTPRSRGPPSVS